MAGQETSTWPAESLIMTAEESLQSERLAVKMLNTDTKLWLRFVPLPRSESIGERDDAKAGRYWYADL